MSKNMGQELRETVLKTQYKTVSLRTPSGYDEVERLLDDDWIVYQSGLFQVTLYKKE
jgi:hypothetical protein